MASGALVVVVVGQGEQFRRRWTSGIGGIFRFLGILAEGPFQLK